MERMDEAVTRDNRKRLLRESAKENINGLIEIINEERFKAIQFAVDGYSVAVALCLRDELGFGKVRVPRVMGKISKMFDAINSGYLELEDCRKQLKEEIGLELR